MCAVELRLKAARPDLHSSNATLVQNPAWRLVAALASLRDLSGNILIPGFYDDVHPPSQQELALADDIPFEGPEMKAKWGLDAFVGDVTGKDALHRHLFQPTCNICGLTAGYQGPGVKTVLPRLASAKLDFRLVPDQDPDRVIALLKNHLADSGFADVEVTPQGGLLSARTSPAATVSKAAIAAAKQTYLQDPVVFPLMVASGPMSLFTDTLATPTVGGGVGNDRSNIHGPDENILVDDFILGIKYVVALLYEMTRLYSDIHPA
jgi:acetylornithine deacetylase/succinyl-diaminopimelate desuccinylase-like protein